MQIHPVIKDMRKGNFNVVLVKVDEGYRRLDRLRRSPLTITLLELLCNSLETLLMLFLNLIPVLCPDT